ncbi:hypothetical protein ACHAW6_006687 [Cyclotella cf. meneghiniana]
MLNFMFMETSKLMMFFETYITAAFFHADVEEVEKIYVEMPHGFRKQGKAVNPKTLYTLPQSPRAFWLCLIKKMYLCGMQKSAFDCCPFIGTKVMCVCYVDDLNFWTPDESKIEEPRHQLISVGILIEEESNAAGSFGQAGLITDRGSKVGHLYTSGKLTPAEAKPLLKDAGGDPVLGYFRFNNIIVMLLCLAGHTRLDNAYMVNSCA